jgi:hypothetical protein
VQGGKVNKDNDQRLSAIADLTAREMDQYEIESQEWRAVASSSERKRKGAMAWRERERSTAGESEPGMGMSTKERK